MQINKTRDKTWDFSCCSSANDAFSQIIIIINHSTVTVYDMFVCICR